MTPQEQQAFQRRQTSFWQDEGAAAIITASARGQSGIVFASNGSPRTGDPTKNIPSLAITAENYNRIARLLEMAGGPAAGRVLDLGCGAGRTTFDLASRHRDALVLGIDTNLALLRLARGAAGGLVSYPRRRIGLAYDRRRFAVALAGTEQVDFWACDALTLPFLPGSADLGAALNLLDCVNEPLRLLVGLAETVRPGGRILLATPYDWSTRATPVETWIGGHSQRSAYAGEAEPFLRALLQEGSHAQSVAGLTLLGEDQAWPWQTRLHERGAVQYRTHLLALARRES